MRCTFVAIPYSLGLRQDIPLHYAQALLKMLSHDIYIHNGSAVLGCILDASKAFDMVDYGVLFCTFRDRGLPLPILRLTVADPESGERGVPTYCRCA